MVQECLYIRATEQIGVTFAVKVNVLQGPVAVAFGGARAEVPTLAVEGYAVKKAGRLAAAGGFVTPCRWLLLMKNAHSMQKGKRLDCPGLLFIDIETGLIFSKMKSIT